MVFKLLFQQLNIQIPVSIAEIRATTGTSPSGSQSSYSTAALTAQNAEKITIGENYFFSNPKLVASQINETNELAGSKSMFLDFNMTTTKENLSPVIDLDRKSVVAFTNRLNNIDSSSDVFPTTRLCMTPYRTRWG